MSYDYAESGPFGKQLSQELGRMAQMNTSFSQAQWESAKQDGCLPCPGKNLPVWPPCGKFIYPTLQKEDQTVLGSPQYDPNLKDCPEGTPWQSIASAKNSLTCAMTRANNFLNNQPGYDTSNSFDHSELKEDTDMASDVARSILRGSIPINAKTREEQYFNSADSAASESEDINENQDYYSLKNLLPCIGNTWTGIAYDMSHYNELPVQAKPDENVHQKKLEYVFVRDDRGKYVMVTAAAILLVILLIVAIVTTSIGSSASSKCGGGYNTQKKVIDLSKLGVENLENMQIVISPKQ